MTHRSVVCALVVTLIAGCSTRQPAPVVERAPSESARRTVVEAKPAQSSVATPPASPRVHVVQRGETLIAVALQYGLDYKELAAWNSIENVNLIHVGQELRLQSPVQTSATPAPTGVVATPLPTAGVPVARPIDAPAAGVPDAPGSLVKTGPLAVKVPYSDKALADMEAEAKGGAGATPTTPPAVPPSGAASAGKPDDEKIDWAWPAKGKLLSGYTEASKGIDIAGTLNAPVLAAADGKVMYSGTGIRGYGKLVILKHNSVFLSAYAHNQTILVKEGQDVKKGQKIAEMGATDTDQVKLHFEIRKQGKPVDPVKLLPAP